MFFKNKEINTNKLFLFTKHRYVQYAFTYYKMNNRLPLFLKYVDVDGPPIIFQNYLRKKTFALKKSFIYFAFELSFFTLCKRCL